MGSVAHTHILVPLGVRAPVANTNLQSVVALMASWLDRAIVLGTHHPINEVVRSRDIYSFRRTTCARARQKRGRGRKHTERNFAFRRYNSSSQCVFFRLWQSSKLGVDVLASRRHRRKFSSSGDSVRNRTPRVHIMLNCATQQTVAGKRVSGQNHCAMRHSGSPGYGHRRASVLTLEPAQNVEATNQLSSIS